MEIVKAGFDRDGEWNDFIIWTSGGSFYERCVGHATANLAAVERGRIVGVVPLVRVRSALFGDIACSMPFVNYGRPCAEDEGVELALLDVGTTHARAWGVNYVEISSSKRLQATPPRSTRSA